MRRHRPRTVGRPRPSTRNHGMLHAGVRQIVLRCNDFKTLLSNGVRHDIKAWGLCTYSALSLYILYIALRDLNWATGSPIHAKENVRRSESSLHDNIHIPMRPVLPHPPSTLAVRMCKVGKTQSCSLEAAAGKRRQHRISVFTLTAFDMLVCSCDPHASDTP